MRSFLVWYYLLQSHPPGIKHLSNGSKYVQIYYLTMVLWGWLFLGGGIPLWKPPEDSGDGGSCQPSSGLAVGGAERPDLKLACMGGWYEKDMTSNG